VKRAWAVLVVGLLVVLASCPVGPSDPGPGEPGPAEPGGTPADPIDLAILYYDGLEKSFEGQFPTSSMEVGYKLHVDGGSLCAVKTHYRLEVRLVPPQCIDCSLELHDASSAKLATLAVSDKSGCDEVKLTYEWEGTCENSDSRDFLIVVTCSPSTSASVSGASFTLYVKPLKVKTQK
jgi:hypothetical protein